MMRGRKIATRPPWVLAAAAGTMTFLIIGAFSMNAGVTGNENANSKPRAKSVVEHDASGATNAELDKGYRGYAINAEAGDQTLLVSGVGDRLDVIASFPAGPDGEPVTSTLVKAASIVEKEKGNRYVILAVTPKEAEKIAFAQANGRIRLAICPPGPDTAVPSKGTSFEDM